MKINLFGNSANPEAKSSYETTKVLKNFASAASSVYAAASSALQHVKDTFIHLAFRASYTKSELAFKLGCITQKEFDNAVQRKEVLFEFNNNTFNKDYGSVAQELYPNESNKEKVVGQHGFDASRRGHYSLNGKILPIGTNLPKGLVIGDGSVKIHMGHYFLIKEMELIRDKNWSDDAFLNIINLFSQTGCSTAMSVDTHASKAENKGHTRSIVQDQRNPDNITYDLQINDYDAKLEIGMDAILNLQLPGCGEYLMPIKTNETPGVKTRLKITYIFNKNGEITSLKIRSTLQTDDYLSAKNLQALGTKDSIIPFEKDNMSATTELDELPFPIFEMRLNHKSQNMKKLDTKIVVEKDIRQKARRQEDLKQVATASAIYKFLLERPQNQSTAPLFQKTKEETLQIRDTGLDNHKPQMVAFREPNSNSPSTIITDDSASGAFSPKTVSSEEDLEIVRLQMTKHALPRKKTVDSPLTASEDSRSASPATDTEESEVPFYI